MCIRDRYKAQGFFLDFNGLYEMDGVSEDLAREAFALAAAKLPLATTFVTRMVG